MRKYSHQCCWCGKKFTEMSVPIMRQHLVLECKEWIGNKVVAELTVRIAELELLYQLAQGRIELGDSKIAELQSRIARMEKAGDGLTHPKHAYRYYCMWCGNLLVNIGHTPDCPVTEWQEAKK